jgi:aldehyde:ferredoxin oxidoreductase
LFGYAGKILYIDLEQKKIEVKPINEEFCRKYIGGNGFATRLLFDNTKKNIDPLGEENVLVFAVGPLTGTIAPTSGKYIVQAKSPLTGFIGESVSSGMWGQALKRAGYDAIIIKGKAEKPTYIFVDDDLTQFEDAKNVWGQDSIESCSLIVKEIGDENVGVTAIGPAGEKCIRFASLTNDRFRQAGRTGMGAVMGSKNLKAIAVRGTQTINVCEIEELMEFSKELSEKSKGPLGEFYRKWGSAGSLSVMNEIGALPTKNWQQSTFDLAEHISAENTVKKYVKKVVACSGCPLGCDHIYVVNKDGSFPETTTSIEWEILYALGSQCGIGDFPTVAKAANLCDQLGIDAISTGVTIGWAMECYEKGILTKEDVDNIELKFGNGNALIEVIKKIANYEDGLGKLLAGGVKRASKKVGKGSEHFAMHNKGLELPGYDLRSLKASALGFNTSTRGGCHLRSQMYDFDTKGKVDRFKADIKFGKITMEREDLLTIVDSLITCKFFRSILLDYQSFSKLYRSTTGIEMSPEDLRQSGERIYNLEKIYNIREGWKINDEYPPQRIMKDPVSDGTAKGAVLKKDEFENMLQAYFKERGWNKEGIPLKQKLLELELEDEAEKFGA